MSSTRDYQRIIDHLLEALQDIEGIVRPTPISRSSYAVRKMRRQILDRIALAIGSPEPAPLRQPETEQSGERGTPC